MNTNPTQPTTPAHAADERENGRDWEPSHHICQSDGCERRAVVYLHKEWRCRIHDGNRERRRNYFASQTKCWRSERGECDALATIMMGGSPHCDKHQIEDERNDWEREEDERKLGLLHAAAPELLAALADLADEYEWQRRNVSRDPMESKAYASARAAIAKAKAQP